MTESPVAAPVLKDTWRRFAAHGMAVTLGCFFRSFLPVLIQWGDPSTAIQYPRWWVALLSAAILSLLGGGINSNLPCAPRELLKSVALGFALNSATILAKGS